MPRLIDDLRRRDARIRKPWFVAEHLAQQWADHCVKLSQMLSAPDLPVLQLDNVADYYFTNSDQEYWDLSRDFPNLAPPFEVFWCEHKMPRVIHSAEAGDTQMKDLVQNGRIGVLMAALTPDQVGVAQGELPENAKWILWAELFIDYGIRGTTADGAHGATFFAIDAEGRLIVRPWLQTFAGAEHNEHIKNYITFFHPSLLAVSFLHCKNVKLVENKVHPPLAKKYHKRHGVEPCAYKTLVIEPLKQILRSEGGHGNGNGLAKAMHICRGHFKDYREGRGLFGKYHQLVWHPSVIRGTKGKQAPPREIEVKV